jgi:hypothetical protein
VGGFFYVEVSCKTGLQISLPNVKDFTMAELMLTPEQEADAQRLTDRVMARTREELLQINRLLVSKPDRQLLGETEFQIRDGVHKIGAHLLETALEERKKGGIKARA